MRKTMYAILATVLVPTLSVAQTGPLPSLGASPNSSRQSTRIDTRKLYEDMEILKVLLKKSVSKAAGVSTLPRLGHFGEMGGGMSAPGAGAGIGSSGGYGGTDAGMAGLMGAMDPHANMPKSGFGIDSFQSVYLPRIGIIYSGQVVMGKTDPLKVIKAKSEPTLSNWERVRNDLLGQKSKQRSKRSSPDSISETVVKALANNGKHLSELQDSESVTVAITLVTFERACATCHSMNANAGMDMRGGSDMMSGGMGMSSKKRKSSSNSTFGGSASPGGMSPGISSSGGGGIGAPPGSPGGRGLSPSGTLNSSSVKSTISLAELHLKHGRFESALRSLSEASTLLQKERLKTKLTNRKGIDLALQSVQVFGMMAQTNLKMGNIKNAVELMAAAKTLAESASNAAKELSTNSNPPEKAAMPLAPRLIITASKKSLTEVGTGKITLDEFRKQIQIQYLDFENQKKQ